MGRTKKRRPNPLNHPLAKKAARDAFPVAHLTDLTADVALRVACAGLKTREKFLLAALIPKVVKLIRKTDPHGTVDLSALVPPAGVN
jgi:hypothetical protein